MIVPLSNHIPLPSLCGARAAASSIPNVTTVETTQETQEVVNLLKVIRRLAAELDTKDGLDLLQNPDHHSLAKVHVEGPSSVDLAFETKMADVIPAPLSPPVAANGLAEAAVEGSTSEVERDRLCNDIVNTGVMAALVGGFALSNMIAPENQAHTTESTLTYLAACFAVHMCTCSCLTSALLYRYANGLHEGHVAEWAVNNRLLLNVPLIKFGMGCLCYLVSVVLLSWQHLEGENWARYTAFSVGMMSVVTVLVTTSYIVGLSQPTDFFKTFEGPTIEIRTSPAASMGTPPGSPQRRQKLRVSLGD